MKFRVVFSVAAEKDVAELLTYLVHEAGEQVARAYVDRLVDYCAGLETFPQRGARRDDLHPGLRIVGYRRKASIAFQVKDGLVTIVRVFQGGQDIVLSDDE